MEFGFTRQELDNLYNVFHLYPEIKTVIIFGSRATDSYKKGSDVDFALLGDIDFDVVAKVKYHLEEETTLPYFFDVVDYAALKNKELKQQIDKNGKIFYAKDN